MYIIRVPTCPWGRYDGEPLPADLYMTGILSGDVNLLPIYAIDGEPVKDIMTWVWASLTKSESLSDTDAGKNLFSPLTFISGSDDAGRHSYVASLQPADCPRSCTLIMVVREVTEGVTFWKLYTFQVVETFGTNYGIFTSDYVHEQPSLDDERCTTYYDIHFSSIFAGVPSQRRWLGASTCFFHPWGIAHTGFVITPTTGVFDVDGTLPPTRMGQRLYLSFTIAVLSIVPLLGLALGFTIASELSTAASRTFLSSAMCCNLASEKIEGEKCPLPMEQQHHRAFFRVALAPSDGVPGQMILVDGHDRITRNGSQMWGVLGRGDVEGVLAVDAQGCDWNRFGDIRGCVLKMTIMGLRTSESPAHHVSVFPNHRVESSLLHSRAKSLVAKFEQGGGRSYIEEAIDLDRDALQLCPPGHPQRSVSLTSLALHLRGRYNQFGATKDLEEAIVLDREALDLHPQGHPDRSISLNGLALDLSTRYEQLGGMDDLDEAIVLAREALDLRSQGHPDRSGFLSNLAYHLSARFQQLGAMEDLDVAIVLDREALNLRSQGHPDRSMSLNNLALDLSTRYQQLGGMEDLDEAIVLDQEALNLRPQGHPDRAGGWRTSTRPLVLDREALDLRPQGHPDRSMSLSNLALDLSTRYQRLEGMEDLDEAIVLDREALVLRPQGHPARSGSLNNLALDLSTRYQHLGGIEDLDEATVLDREALELRPQGHPDRSMSLNNLAVDLFTRYQQLGGMEELNEAVVLDREALGLRPQGHPDRSMSLSNLALRLAARYKQLGVVDDLDEAIVLGREALDLRPQGHPLRSDSLNNLARHICDRFTHLRQLKDEEEVFGLYAQLADVRQIVSPADLSAARAWIHMAKKFQHSTILLAHETSLRFLTQHLATLPSLPQHLVLLKNLTSSLAVDAFSACLHHHAPALAVELLEQGRGVFWSQLTRLRSPLDGLVMSSPAGKKLADEFTRLALLIRNALNSPGADQHERLCHLNLDMERVVTNVRELPGLSRFLLPSLFSDLRRAASGGPVIIVNASNHSCDALIVLLDRDPVRIPLQITREGVRDLSTELHSLTVRAKRLDVTRELAAFLRELWDQIVLPIVDFLQTIHPTRSRIWWCPTAEFSVLPLHTAGPYRKGQRNLADIYVSSYTPTLTALIRARRHDPSSSAAQRKRFIAIGQANATGESELLSVGAELDNVVHLACHGLPNRKKPFESAFALRDGHFMIQCIIGCDLKNPEFAYLSACHTTVGDEESPDEAIHLASAMQFAGFRSVIGTMWAVDDGETNKITSIFYKYMVDESGRLDHTCAAFALNKTMKSVNVPFDQRILYIHLGA
ncbi:hypothetical protein HD554DRAFT_2038263 [Boletus coccyginus]|nr:hypothetical protein HD554DRAFT_2038263 [Boletus coccyginus]